MIFNDYETHQARWDKLSEGTDQPDKWIIHDEHVLIIIKDSDMMDNAKRMKKIRIRNMFDRYDSEDKPRFQNITEVTAFFEVDRLWSIVDINEEFLKKLGLQKSISFGTPEKSIVLPVHDIDDLDHVLKTWKFFRDDDEYFKYKN